MIPKIIHYCWFGGQPLPKADQRYVRGWRKMCPDFKLVKWSEKNFNYRKHLFTKKAYRLRNWAAVSDYVRLFALKRFGGVYMDTDVKMIKPITPLLHQRSFIGMESPKAIASGLIFGAQPDDPNVNALLRIYDRLARRPDFKAHLNDQVYITTAHFYRQGFVFANLKQVVDGCTVYPTRYFCPKRLDQNLQTEINPSTYTIHEYADSWSNDQNNHRQITFDHELKRKLRYYLNMMK